MLYVFHNNYVPSLLCIGDINPPAAVKVAMEMQAEAERKKRASILDSEGKNKTHLRSSS